MRLVIDHTLTADQATLVDHFDDGYYAGWAAAQRFYATSLPERDEQLARRIVALLLQHGYNQDLVESVTRTQPYAERGIPRQVAP